MGYLLNVLSGLSFFKRRDDDDITDRLHYFLTTNLLIMLSILVSWKQFGGKPIECMVPDTFPSGWEQYAESYCWAQDTYFLPFREEVPKDVSEREDRNIGYYQWVPFFLLIESICFFLPSFVWQMFNGASGIKVSQIVRQAKDKANIKPDCRNNSIRLLTVHLENALRFQRRRQRRQVRPHKIFRCLNFPYKASYVTTLYLFVKLLYLVNVVVQFFLMNLFMETSEYTYYGFGALQDIFNGTQWQHSGTFPRVTLCDLEVRVMANVQRYTIQCVLVINLFNEKIFIFLWFWYVFLAFATLASFLYWFTILVFPCPPRGFINRHLELSEMPFDSIASAKDVDKFVNTYLQSDGVFVLRMISMHTGVIMGTELVAALWQSWFGVGLKAFMRSDSEKAAQQKEAMLENVDSGGGAGKSLPPPEENRVTQILRQRFGHRRNDKKSDKGDSDSEEVLVCTYADEQELADLKRNLKIDKRSDNIIPLRQTSEQQKQPPRPSAPPHAQEETSDSTAISLNDISHSDTMPMDNKVRGSNREQENGSPSKRVANTSV